MTRPEVVATLAACRMSEASKARMLALYDRRDQHAAFALLGLARRHGIVARDPQAVTMSAAYFGAAK